MLCVVCGLNPLSGQQTKYCSRNCERKGWRYANKQKILDGKKRYREANKEKISLYQRLYKTEVKQINSDLSRRLRTVYNCLRCGTTLSLDVHHIKHQKYGGGNNDLNNLVVLCESCHARWHKYFDIDYWKIV